MVPQSGCSGGRLIVRPPSGPALLLPVSREGCVHLVARVVASSLEEMPAIPSDGEHRPPRPQGAGATPVRGDEPDAAIVVWWDLTGSGGNPLPTAGGAAIVAAIEACFVVGQGPSGMGDVTVDAWNQWLSAQPPAGPVGDGRAAVAARRIRAGDLPRAAAPGDPPASAEARLLAETLALAASQRRLFARWHEEVASARFEACRELAYGAGHEINNPLANIATRAQTLLVGETDQERRRRLSTIVDQAFRARDLIGGLMLFARPPRPRPTHVDADALVAAVLGRTASVAGSRRVLIEHRRSAREALVWADAVQVEEALRAVVINAIEAVRDGGTVTVEVHGPSEPCSGGPVTRMVVIDDGIGMDAATLRRAYDPFFSGREAGRGAGLGLSKARRFLAVNGGGIALESRPGAGTRAEISLPSAPSAGLPTGMGADGATS